MQPPWICLCCGVEWAELAEERESIERHHYGKCAGGIYIEDRADVRELKEKLLEACVRLNEGALRELHLKLLCKRLQDEIQGLQTFYATLNAPKCPFCASETVFLAEAFAKDNLHSYRCRECRRKFSRPPLVSLDT